MVAAYRLTTISPLLTFAFLVPHVNKR